MALTHSILVNLFVKVGLNIFSPTSPAKYCFCPRVFNGLCTLRWLTWTCTCSEYRNKTTNESYFWHRFVAKYGRPRINFSSGSFYLKICFLRFQ